MFKGDGAGRDALFKADGILCDADLFNDCTDGLIPDLIQQISIITKKRKKRLQDTDHKHQFRKKINVFF